jgi:hypothetical protein
MAGRRSGSMGAKSVLRAAGGCVGGGRGRSVEIAHHGGNDDGRRTASSAC